VERELNETLADTGKVKFAFRAHFTDTANGVNGIEQLIRAIMISRGCVHPKGSELRMVRAAMYLFEVQLVLSLIPGIKSLRQMCMIAILLP